MPVGTPFHERTSALCHSLNYRDWAGYYTVSSYETHHEHEYNAIRNGAAVIDISPLFKYLVTGSDAVTLVDRVITRDARRLQQGQVVYTPWCNERGQVMDDGTVTRLADQAFRWTAAEPNLRWFRQQSAGLNVQIDDVSEDVAALAVQGPTSADLIASVAHADIGGLKYFRMTSGTIAGADVDISRTGYTGDLGFEIWMKRRDANTVWDALASVGSHFALRPAGMLALDVARVEAGLLLIDVDFNSSKKALVDEQRYTPFEMGLARLVNLDKNRFVGQAALIEEHKRGPAREIVGLEIDWPQVESIYEAVGLPPAVSPIASRVAVPVFKEGMQVGKATTTTWSPTLKRMIALATVRREYTRPGTRLQFEITVEAVRHHVRATVVKTPFFNPKRKTATPIT